MQTENQTAAHALLKAPAGRESIPLCWLISLSPTGVRTYTHTHSLIDISLNLKYIRCEASESLSFGIDEYIILHQADLNHLWKHSFNEQYGVFATQIRNIVIGEGDRYADRQQTCTFFDLQCVPAEQCCLEWLRCESYQSEFKKRLDRHKTAINALPAVEALFQRFVIFTRNTQPWESV